MKINSFFAGAGGFDLGFINAGFEIGQAWDYDKYAVQSYATNIGDHIKLADIREMTGQDIPEADGYLFGFPCQDVSMARVGLNAGMIKGVTRTGLFYEIMRLLREVKEKPRFILAENVMGLKKYLPVIEEEYDQAGYDFFHTIYDSKFFGVPQSRKRFFLLGIRKDLKKNFTFREAPNHLRSLDRILENEVPKKLYYPDSEEVLQLLINKFWEKDFCTGDIKVLGHLPSINGHDLIKRVYHTGGVSPTLNTCEGGNRQPKVLLLEPEGWRVRKLSPREFARLQGFPDSYIQYVSDSQFYKQMGNAVTVPVAQYLALQIKELFR